MRKRAMIHNDRKACEKLDESNKVRIDLLLKRWFKSEFRCGIGLRCGYHQRVVLPRILDSYVTSLTMIGEKLEPIRYHVFVLCNLRKTYSIYNFNFSA